MIRTKLKIRTYGDPVLRKEAEPIDKVGPAEIMLIQAMINTISEKETDIGLAAPQIGVSKQIFIIDLGDGPSVFVNPKISNPQGKEEMDEGCLSFPGLSFKIKRPKSISMDYTDENGEERHIECEGFLARVILHEYDHLHAKMIIDYASDKEKQEQKAQIDKLAAKTEQELKESL
ncbi:MAG: peptide deformylase [Candidatus Aceula meridiana]|nr:peptide deformylase [Candidatus Aceula meridiana]